MNKITRNTQADHYGRTAIRNTSHALLLILLIFTALTLYNAVTSPWAKLPTRPTIINTCALLPAPAILR